MKANVSADWTDIGFGVDIRDFLDARGHKLGIFERHFNNTGERCQGGAILFDGINQFDGYPQWDVVSFDPLTIKTEIKCSRCGHRGWIHHGKWVSR